MNERLAVGGAGVRASAVAEVAGVEAEFADAVGCVAQRSWVEAAGSTRFEELSPVSAFPVVPGRRWGPGWWWSATTGGHVVHGSAAMRDRLMVLDRDPRVVGLAGRPVRLLWRDAVDGRTRSWVPQVFARYADGTALLADCPSRAGAGGERALRAAAVVTAACDAVGWSYRRLGPLDAVLAANLRWLAGYRHPRYQGPPELRALLGRAFAAPRPLAEGAVSVGDPLRVLPAVYHALWSGRLGADLGRPLHERVLVGPGGRGDARAGGRSGAAGLERG
ncbi:TnsA-like heteromeric transposase endonuclease subunit [Embleya scabrispora]|uniref:TnsA-like heteromeric transposase endonuclease subunit n=1 Tax=Embleya scabrispora TaxID=159449 RepID=UPI001FE09D13|nr:TnsA-like heteromeric transposase endonuclease subunit [Embleya scabrispora]